MLWPLRVYQPHPALMPTAGGGPSPATYTPIYSDAQAFGFGPGPYTSPSQTWTAGQAVVFIFSTSAHTDFTVTIKGVTATQISGYSTGQRGSLWQATVTAGAGTVVVSATTNVFDGIYTAGGVVTTTTTTASGSQVNDMLVAAEPQSTVTVTVPTNGAGVFFAAGAFGTSASLPLTWTGVTRDAITETFIGAASNSSSIAGGGAHTTTSGSTTPTVSSANSTFNFTGGSGAMAAIAFSP